jgi:hypothetical protein
MTSTDAAVGLASWRDTPVRERILAFVERVSAEVAP